MCIRDSEPAAEGQSGQVIIQIAAGLQPVREQGLLNGGEPEFPGFRPGGLLWAIRSGRFSFARITAYVEGK